MPLNLSKPLILASNSPRRREIMLQAGFQFEVKVKPTDETFSAEMPVEEVPIYLAKTKALCFADDLENEIVLCADTIVVVENQILNKPQDVAEAQAMLKLLSGKTHRVITGVCLMNKEKMELFSDTTLVTFKALTNWDIDYYIETCQPYDKAGAYGVQDFIGMAGITEITGSFYTVMGLPIHKVYEALQKYMI